MILRRARFWIFLGAGIVVAAFVVALLSPSPGRALDPSSPSKAGSKALARLLAASGVRVHRTLSVPSADGTALLVTAPDDYSATQLRRLTASRSRVVLLDPSARTLRIVAPQVTRGAPIDGVVAPMCAAPGARAAGAVDFDAGATTFDVTGAATSCYGGAVVLTGRLAILGSPDLLRNDALGRRGVAALDVNVLTADRSIDGIVWLLPGTDAGGPGGPFVWDLFPPGVRRAFAWSILTGLIVVLWRGRRLGPPVGEPLPVVVRAAEVVEGHGRLYRRAEARERAAEALRTGTATRLANRPRVPQRAASLLSAPSPRTDAELVEFAAALRELETAARSPERKVQ